MVALAGQCAEKYPQVRAVPEGEVLPPTPPRRSSPLHRLSPEQVAELVAAREAGALVNELAERFGVHRATVINHLERAGATGRRWPGRGLTPEQVPEAVRLYESGLSLVAVGERFEVDKRQVSRALREAGVEIRGPGRGKN